MRNNFLDSIPPVTRNLIIFNLLMWIAQLTVPTIAINLFRLNIDLTNILGLHYWDAEQFRWHQVVTYLFLHDTSDIMHLLFNMFSLWMFGRIIEQVWGQKRFLIYYITTGVGAAIMQQIVWSFMLMPYAHEPNFQYAVNAFITIGASGAVYGILLAFGMLFPNMPIYLMFIPIPIKAKYMVIGYGVLELYLGFTSSGNIAHFAHLGGMLFGLILILMWKKNNNGNIYF